MYTISTSFQIFLLCRNFYLSAYGNLRTRPKWTPNPTKINQKWSNIDAKMLQNRSLEEARAALGAYQGTLGVSWCISKVFWGILGASWGVLGVSWAASWGVLGLSWEYPGTS